MKRFRVFKKKRSSREEFLKGYDLLWQNTAPVKYQNPERWREPPKERLSVLSMFLESRAGNLEPKGVVYYLLRVDGVYTD